MIDIGTKNLKTRKAVGIIMDIQIYEQLKEYSEKTMIPMSRIVDKAIKEYLLRETKKN